MHKQAEAERLRREELERQRREEAQRQAQAKPAQETQPILVNLEIPEAAKPPVQAAPLAVKPPVKVGIKPAPVRKAEEEELRRRQAEKAARERAEQARPPTVRVPVSAAPTPKPPVRPAPAVPLRARLGALGQVLRQKLARIPWQVWRTLAGLIILALLWVGISRACARRRAEAPPAPAAVQPLTEPCRPPAEPYLD